jgi:phenylalanyl-tRNA synthetase beta chain
MKASFQWLRAMVPGIPDDPKQVADRLTAAGLEVEGMHAYGEGAEACVVARVVSMRPHPSRSALRLVTVDRGQGGAEATIEVVCGAPNVPEPGGLVVFAPLGAHLPAVGMTIERRAIGGVTSEGMLCSERELGLSDEGEGILVLPAGTAEPGARLVSAIPAARDTVFEIGLTPNRPDGLGHVGLARELAALYGLPFQPPAPAAPARVAQGSIDALIDVVIEDGERCPHYAAAAVVDVTVGPSPLWLRYRLSALGVRPISNVVDVTNLLMLEYAHPMHAFDLDKIRGGKIVVRRARAGEVLRTLDGVERKLALDDLVIADAEGALALAGVMGGATSEVSATTKRVLLECAYFDPRTVRRSSRRHGLHTESSHRFERGIDHGDTPDALAHAAATTVQLSGGAAVPNQKLVVARHLPKVRVALRPSRIDKLLGAPVPRDEAIRILESLGFARRDETAEAVTFEAPSHRPDIAREVDLIEEVARVRGMDAIPTVLPAIRPSREGDTREQLARRARAAAVALGLSEAVTYGFVSPADLLAIGAPEASVVLKNPLSELSSVMRTSVLPGVLEALKRARRHGEKNVKLFTVGAAFLKDEGTRAPREAMQLAAVYAGERNAHLTKPEPVDVWDGKGLVLGMVERLTGFRASIEPFSASERPPHLHPRAAAAVIASGRPVGRVGLLHPSVIAELDLGGEAVVVELDLDAVATLGVQTPKFQPLPRFPAATRDLALVVHDGVRAGDIEGAVREAAGDLAEAVEIFDRFTGGSVPPEHASLAFRVVYRAPDRTLTDAEIDARHVRVVATVEERFGAKLRA